MFRVLVQVRSTAKTPMNEQPLERHPPFSQQECYLKVTKLELSACTNCPTLRKGEQLIIGTVLRVMKAMLSRGVLYCTPSLRCVTF